jgi:hypothetical protein
LFFLNEQPDTNYYVIINGGAPCMAVDTKETSYVVITAKDGVGGTAVDPQHFSVQIFRQ